MKAITVASPGSALILSELPVPEPADDQILVKVIYTAINPVYVTALNRESSFETNGASF